MFSAMLAVALSLQRAGTSPHVHRQDTSTYRPKALPEVDPQGSIQAGICKPHTSLLRPSERARMGKFCSFVTGCREQSAEQPWWLQLKPCPVGAAASARYPCRCCRGARRQGQGQGLGESICCNCSLPQLMEISLPPAPLCSPGRREANGVEALPEGWGLGRAGGCCPCC